jgi:HSP20 family molecular chaperone IbpA
MGVGQPRFRDMSWPAMNPDNYPPTLFMLHHPLEHNIFRSHFPSLFSHHHDAERMISPEADVREEKSEYWVDISLPGVSDGESIIIECPTPRQITVSSSVERPQLPTAFPSISKGELGKDSDALSGHAVAPDAPEKSEKEHHFKPRFLIAERNVGVFHRTFTFPQDIDDDHIRAKLENGLLRIQVPKSLRGASRNIKVDK